MIYFGGSWRNKTTPLSNQKSQFVIYLDSPLLLLRLSSSLHPAMVKSKTADTPDNLNYYAARSHL